MPADKGIYGLMSQLTVTGAFVNKTLFEQAKVPMPGDQGDLGRVGGRERRKVAKATQDAVTRWRWTAAATASRRSRWRYGAKIFDAKGAPVIDDGYKTAVKKFVEWNKDGLMPKEVWGGIGGSAYRDAFEEFANGRVVMYYSGSWQVKRMDTQVTQDIRLGRGARALRSRRPARRCRAARRSSR